jgi:hypothetical protein
MELRDITPDKKSIAYSILTAIGVTWLLPKAKNYVSNQINGIAEKAGESFAKRMYEQENPANPGYNSSIQQPQQPYVQENVDPVQQFYEAILEQNKTLTGALLEQKEALLEQTEAIKKMPDKIGYRVEKNVAKALKNKKGK